MQTNNNEEKPSIILNFFNFIFGLEWKIQCCLMSIIKERKKNFRMHFWYMRCFVFGLSDNYGIA